MTNWKKYTLAVAIITVAGFAYVKNSQKNIPSDLRDAVADVSESKDFDTSIATLEKVKVDIPAPVRANAADKKAGNAEDVLATLYTRLFALQDKQSDSEISLVRAKRELPQLVKNVNRANTAGCVGCVPQPADRVIADARVTSDNSYTELKNQLFEIDILETTLERLSRDIANIERMIKGYLATKQCSNQGR